MPYSNGPSDSSSKTPSGSSKKDHGSSKPSTTKDSSGSSGTKKNTKKSSTYDSYDDGYDDIYMNGDYDYDRYKSDSDYANGVDDAMDEFEEDW